MPKSPDTPLNARIKNLLLLALPIMGAQLATSGMGVIDTIMSGRYNAEALAAVAIGSSLWVPLMLFFKGIMTALIPTVAHLVGASDEKAIPPIFQQSLWLALLTGGLGFYLLRNVHGLLDFLQVSAEITATTLEYIRALAWGFPAIVGYMALSSYCEGRAFTRPGMIFAFAGLLANIPANYILIYGMGPIPELGAAGCGYATAISAYIMLAMMVMYLLKTPSHARLKLFANFKRPQWLPISKLLRLGTPIGISIFVEASIFSAIALLIARLSTEVIAGHQIALNFATLIYMLPLSIGIALTIQVGQAVGAGQLVLARKVAFSGMGFNTLIAFTSMLILYCLREPVAAFYSDNLEVQAIASFLLIYAAIFQIPDSIQIAATGALRGYKDTKVPMLLILITYWLIALPLGYALGLMDIFGAALGPEGFWIGLLSGLSIAAVALTWRLNKISLRKQSQAMSNTH